MAVNSYILAKFHSVQRDLHKETGLDEIVIERSKRVRVGDNFTINKVDLTRDVVIVSASTDDDYIENCTRLETFSDDFILEIIKSMCN